MAGRSVNSTVAAVFGAVHTLVGIAGSFVSDTFAEQDDSTRLGFEVDDLHNVVHLVTGVALLAAARRTHSARTLDLLIGATCVLLGLLGPLITGTEANVLALNGPDHGLHLRSGAVPVAVALLADRTRRRSDARGR